MKHLFRVGDRVYDRFHMKAGMVIRAEDEDDIKKGWVPLDTDIPPYDKFIKD